MKPNSQITFSIDGQDIVLIFNNSSLNALSAILFGNQTKAFDFVALLNEINKLNAENFLFACKAIIYSGIVGYYLESDQPKPAYTFKEVGKLVGQMTESELIEYTGKVWDSFIDELGMNLEQLKQLEEQEQGEKKK